MVEHLLIVNMVLGEFPCDRPEPLDQSVKGIASGARAKSTCRIISTGSRIPRVSSGTGLATATS